MQENRFFEAYFFLKLDKSQVLILLVWAIMIQLCGFFQS